MMRSLLSRLWLMTTAAMLCGCGHTQETPAGTAPEQSPVVRIDTLIGKPLKPEVYDSIRPGLEAWRSLNRLSSDLNIAADDSLMYGFAASRPYAVFMPDVLAQDTAFDGLTVPALRGAKAVYGIISPFRQPVVTVDSVVLVALNHYLGAGYPGYEGLPETLRRFKTPERIPFDVTEAAIAASISAAPGTSDKLLAQMVYEGALALVVQERTGADETSVMGWTDEEYTQAGELLSDVWRDLVNRDLLFANDRQVTARLMDPRNTPEGYPPRLGRWIGMQICRAWLDKHPGSAPDDILDQAVYLSPTLLPDAGFNP